MSSPQSRTSVLPQLALVLHVRRREAQGGAGDYRAQRQRHAAARDQPYFDPTGSTSEPPSDAESVVMLVHLDPDWLVCYLRLSELKGQAVVAESAFPAVDVVR